MSKFAAMEFFLAHAGFSWDPKTETQAQGKLRCARELAEAEEWFKAQGCVAGWDRDPEGDDADCWVCVVRHPDGRTVSLCNVDRAYIFDGTTRVTEAELALELMKESQ